MAGESDQLTNLLIRLGIYPVEKSKEFRELMVRAQGLAASASLANESLEKLYVPIYLWCREKLKGRLGEQPLVIGLSAPQGAGKTTLVTFLVELFRKEGIAALGVSIDDFYFSRREQEELANTLPENPYLQSRGYPGTHDIPMGLEVLSALRGIGLTGRVDVPRYDKSAHGGLGDRLPKDRWTRVNGPLDVVILEGWMLGFRTVAQQSLADDHLRTANTLLPEYEFWYRTLDAFIHLAPERLEPIIKWRVEAEENRKASGQDGLSSEEVENYIRLFLPAYQAYVEPLRQRPLCPKNSLTLVIGDDRLPV